VTAHLTDCFIDLVAYVAYFQKSVAVKQPPYDKVKADILRLLAQGEAVLKKGQFSREEYDQARFIVCAWIDEAILSSPWNQKSQWQREQLQRVYYQTTEAGEEAFERLNAVGLHQRDVREVYYLCMALGFTGRYCKKGDEYLLDQLKTSNLKILLGSSTGLPSLEKSELFPEAYPKDPFEADPQRRRFGSSVLTLVGLAAPVLLFGFLYLIYRFTLSGTGGSLLQAIR
jgi:type VI secretion system protein ImpK